MSDKRGCGIEFLLVGLATISSWAFFLYSGNPIYLTAPLRPIAGGVAVLSILLVVAASGYDVLVLLHLRQDDRAAAKRQLRNILLLVTAVVAFSVLVYLVEP